MTVAFGAGLPLEGPLAELLAAAEEAERLGYAFLWANDDRLQRDPFAMLAAFALRTRALRLGPGVTNPYSRHPALIAAGVATLDELSGGRAVLGLGAGGTNHRALGVERRQPAVALREAVALIRTLLAGGTATVDGQVIRAREARLECPPPRPDLPIYLGARGPRILELAGEVADGVIVGNVASAAGWRYALDRVRRGAERAGRDPSELRLVAWFSCSIADDDDLAADAVRPMVATSLVTSRPVLDELGVEMPGAFADEMERRGWRLHREHLEAAGRLVPDDVVRRFAVAGSPATCRRDLAELLEALPQIDQVAIVPFANARHGVREVVTRFIAEVGRPASTAAPSVSGASR